MLDLMVLWNKVDSGKPTPFFQPPQKKWVALVTKCFIVKRIHGAMAFKVDTKVNLLALQFCSFSRKVDFNHSDSGVLTLAYQSKEPF